MSETIIIDCRKIIEWMVDRKKLPKEWPKKHKAIQLKMKKIIENNTISDKILQEYIQINKETFNFANVLKIIEELIKSDEGKEKNFFGNFSSPVIKEWLALKELFQNENLHIVDLGKIISQNTTFEIPALKKNIAALENLYKDDLQKVNDYKTAIKGAERDYIYHCEKIGIKGQNLEKEVLELILALPQIFRHFIQKIKDPMTNEILKYYYDFTIYINSKQDHEKMHFPILEYLIAEDDDLIDYFNAKCRKETIEPTLKELNEKRYEYYEKSIEEHKVEKTGYTEIDEINWDIDFSVPEKKQHNEIINNNEDINWGDFLAPVENPVSEEIQIEVVDQSNLDQPNTDLQIKNVIKDEWEIIEMKDEKMYGTDTILSNREKRNEIVANLFELLYFLKQRCYETKIFSSNSLLQAYDHSTSTSLFEITADKLEKYIIHIDELINLITNTKALNLFIIKDQPKARERIANSLTQYKINQKKNEYNIENLQKQIIDLENLINESKIRLKTINEDTFFAKDVAEKLMKDLIKREVNFTGF